MEVLVVEGKGYVERMSSHMHRPSGCQGVARSASSPRCSRLRFIACRARYPSEWAPVPSGRSSGSPPRQGAAQRGVRTAETDAQKLEPPARWTDSLYVRPSSPVRAPVRKRR